MEVSLPKCGDEEKALLSLLEAFGSLFSLEQIASAYCKAGRNADLVGQILHNTDGRMSESSTYASEGEERFQGSSASSIGYTSENSCYGNDNFRVSKPKWRPVSGGTISSVLGKDYVKFMPTANGPPMATKPLKLDARVLPMSELWEEENQLNLSKNDHMHKEMEDFLFKMLGDDFQLERDVIQQVLDKCGYDMQKSMEKLLDLSAVTLDERSKYLGKSTEKVTDACPNSEELSSNKEVKSMNSSGSSAKVSKLKGEELPQKEKARNDKQKEVLDALFSSAKRSEALVRKKARAARRSKALGQLVVEPPNDVNFEHEDESVNSWQKIDNDEDEEDDYQLLRRAVKEYRATMKEYYKAAVHAFSKGDHNRANKLMDEGHFFHEKAREADEESSRKIFETKNSETQNDILLDLHDHGAKEAIRLLKCHLSSLSGIPSIKYLKVIIETNEEDITKGARRRLVMKLLEKESIQWTEGGGAGEILIHLDDINPTQLSFAKK